jgi:acetyltransferase-like isoleucine patch superfamily enzyme
VNHSDIFLPDNRFRFIDAVRESATPWGVLDRLRSIIVDAVGDVETGVEQLDGYALVERVTRPDGSLAEVSINVRRTLILSAPLSVDGIGVGVGTMLEAGAILKAPALIGDACEIRQGAYIRGDVIAGNRVVIGHVTEVKNAMLMDGAAAGHFAYVGDAILGARVNLGAGTKIANLQFRTRAEIDGDFINPVVIRHGERMIDTGRGKLGAVIGDYSEIGCNTVTGPGAVVGAHCWIYPNTTLPKGFHPQRSLIRPTSAGRIERTERNL